MERGSRAEVPESAHFVADARGVLACDGADLEALAARFGTPLHVVSAAAIRAAHARLREALAPASPLVCYAVKANGAPGDLRLLAGLGAGADVVSGGELHWALRAGIPAARVVMSGVGKTDAEIEAALRAGVRSLHVESAAELEVVAEIAAHVGVRARVGLRVNPDVDARTHPYIATGLHDTKFGLALDDARALLPALARSTSLSLACVACHIGSQLSDAGALREAVALTARFLGECRATGLAPESLDVGGGWPIAYGDEDAPFPTWEALGAAVRAGIADARLDTPPTLVVEPGRALVGDAGALLSKVLFEKSQSGKRFVIVDAAMTELVRPALYGAYHAIVPVRPRPGPRSAADVVGPVCETGDFLATDRALPPLSRGDLVLVRGTGAYGASMASEYNARPRAAEVMIDGADVLTLRRRGRIEALFDEG